MDKILNNEIQKQKKILEELVKNKEIDAARFVIGQINDLKLEKIIVEKYNHIESNILELINSYDFKNISKRKFLIDFNNFISFSKKYSDIQDLTKKLETILDEVKEEDKELEANISTYIISCTNTKIFLDFLRKKDK